MHKISELDTLTFHPEPPGISKHSKKALARGLKLMYMNGKDFGESNHKVEGTHSWWNLNVENMYRCQVAGYRDENQYLDRRRLKEVDKWPDSGLIRKLVRWDGNYYYFGEERECPKLTSSDVKKALLRETVIFEKSPFTNQKLTWAPVLSKMTQKYNEALAEIVSQNPRPQKMKSKKLARHVSQKCVQFVEKKRKKKMKVSSETVTKFANKILRNAKQIKCSLCPKGHNSKRMAIFSMKKIDNNAHNSKLHNIFTTRQLKKSHLQRNKRNLNTSPICESLQRMKRYEPNLKSLSLKAKYAHVKSKYGDIKYLSSSSPTKCSVLKDNSNFMSYRRNNKIAKDSQSITISNTHVTTERYAERSNVRKKNLRPTNYWFPEESLGNSNNCFSNKALNPKTIAPNSNSVSPSIYSIGNGMDSTLHLTVRRNPISSINTISLQDKTNVNCDVQKGSMSRSGKNISQYYKWTHSDDTLESNYESFSKESILPKSKSSARTEDKDFVLKNSNEIQSRKIKTRSKLYITKIDVDDCLFSDRNEASNIRARSNRLNSCGAVLDLSLPASKKDFNRTNINKLTPKNEIGDPPKITPYTGSKRIIKLPTEHLCVNKMAFSNVELPELHLPSYRKSKNSQRDLLIKNRYNPFQELTLIDLYDTTGRGWASGSGLTHGDGGEPDALDLLVRWGGATCSGPTQIRDVQDMSRVVTGKIDHGALRCGRDHEQLTKKDRYGTIDELQEDYSSNSEKNIQQNLAEDYFVF
ncbi:hypothetical protein C0J52_17512 [Blattella germanica]|nr:hypothetical protein C0J52_17512 [Blattella germanica]